MLTLHANRQGEVDFDAEGAKSFWVGAVGYASCSEKRVGSLPEDYLINDIVQTGSLSSNDCGQINSQVQPGRLLYFVKREGWAERFNNQNN